MLLFHMIHTFRLRKILRLITMSNDSLQKAMVWTPKQNGIR
ncbi:hypothetical protein SAMN05216226_12111 [Halovenus aranensis]|uniref:Uncharacterized protein n=1 Tax=Halovenus aranensis TaxID=890420 RepID=A0A1G8ZDC2_9EURY|nr:hypothetical protein SAMN05216226_12111 [Halovenus aranensis]